MSAADSTSRPEQDPYSGGPGRVGAHPVLWLMIAVMIGFEVMFAAVDAGLLPPGLGRWPVYQWLAFLDFRWTAQGIVRVRDITQYGVQYGPAGPWVLWTFLTHAFLHGGWLHLALNGAAFMGLGHLLVRALGIGRFLVLFAVSAAAGALAFWQISHSPYPMVGASGALFGMLAVITAWQERALRLTGRSRTVIWQRIGALVVLNAVLALGLSGLLAWQAHLGGWVAGWLLAGVYRPRHGMVPMF